MPESASGASAKAAPPRVDATFAEEFLGASASASECQMNLVHTASLLLAEIDRYRRTVTDLSAVASQVLAIIEGAGEPLPPHVVAERLLVTSGTLTSVLDTLERRGLIVRIPHPTDRRKLLIDITDSSRSLVDALLPRIHAAALAVFAPLSEVERATLIALTSRVQQQIASLKESPPALETVYRNTPLRG